LNEVAKLDWSSVEPAIFGTLFERSLDPDKRAQLGAHYTSRSDILLIVEPVLMQPYRREWEAVQAGVVALQTQWQTVSGAAHQKLRSVAEAMIFDFMDTLSKVRVLDPACGSGNFLYVALNQMKGLEKEVWAFAKGVSLEQPELGVSPAHFHGIEKNPFAAELAQVVVWIGYLQWLKVNGFLDDQPKEPILQSLHTIECKDAILAFDADGQPVEPEWPAVDVIIGNPPFLGGNKVRKEMGDNYVEALFTLYRDRVPAFADLVCYWFEKARAHIEKTRVQRVGLLATNSITGGVSRRVLERIAISGTIFMAWDDRPWILDGASVRVVMVGFDDGRETKKMLNGVSVQSISPDLKGDLDTTKAQRLRENAEIAFIGDTKKGQFDISSSVALEILSAPLNSNGRLNADVVKPWINGLDLTRRPRGMWIIDFGIDMIEDEAALYKLPYEYTRNHVKPERDKVRNHLEQTKWWIHGRPAPDLRSAISNLRYYIATPRVSKYRIFSLISTSTLPDGQVVVIAREDLYFFGVLHSCLHEAWALRMGTTLEDRPRYSQTFTFETYPFPWPPGTEPTEDADPRVKAIADAARNLVHLRDAWLNEPGLSEAELKKRTLTNLYNARPDWLSVAHRTLDAAVFAAYGWPDTLSDDEILSRLLALNLERAAGHGAAVPVGENDQADDEEE